MRKSLDMSNNSTVVIWLVILIVATCFLACLFTIYLNHEGVKYEQRQAAMEKGLLLRPGSLRKTIRAREVRGVKGNVPRCVSVQTKMLRIEERLAD